MNSNLARELTLIVSIKVLVIALVWFLFFSDKAPAIEPVKVLF